MPDVARVTRVGVALMCFCGAAMVLAQSTKPREQDHPYQRDRWFMRGRTINGRPGAAELHQAYRQKMKKRAARAHLSATQTLAGAAGHVNSAGAAQSITVTTPGNGTADWTPLGPAPAATAADISQDYGPAVGRMTTVVVDPGDPSGNTVYVGGATGGVWKSVDAAHSARDCSASGSCIATDVHWTPLIDDEPSLTVGAIALQPASGLAQTILVGTGEANSSADSYYGQGFLRSTDGGSTWTSITTANQSPTSSAQYDLTGIGFLKITFGDINRSNLVVAAGASSSVGPQTGAQQGADPRLGLYYSLDSGATWTRAAISDGSAGTPDPGSATDVVYNPILQRFFAAVRFHGMYSSADGINWTKLPNQPAPSAIVNGTNPCPPTLSRSCNFYRAALATVPNRNEMYAFVVDVNDGDQGIYQTLDGGNTWATVSTAGLANCGDGTGNGCDTDQGSYNLTLAALPNGSATDLYAGAVNEFKCTLTGSGPAASTCSFMNLTHVYGCTGSGGLLTSAHVHPDEHGIAFVSDATHPIYFANDGGVYRVLDGSTLNSGACPASPTPSLFDNLNANMGSMLQFVSFSQHPSDDTILFGGTQDNGTPKKNSTAPLNPSGYGYVWGAAHIGDGGYTELNPLNDDWFASYAGLVIQRCAGKAEGACTDADFPPDSTQIDSTKVNGDSSTFYPVYTLDPASLNSSAASTEMVLGTCRIWRGNSDGSAGTTGNPGWSPGSPISNNFDTSINSVCDSSAVNYVSALAVGGPTAAATSTHPKISQVIYAGTEGFPASASGATGTGGRLFVTFSADTAATSTNPGPGSGWTELTRPSAGACTASASACNINPGHYNISGIAIDPADATGRTAYVTVMGFHVKHVLKTTDGGAAWTALDGDPNNGGLPDAPADAVVVHPEIPGQIYVGTDVGVFVYDPVQQAWSEMTPAGGAGFLPNVPITKLAIFNSGATIKLRASTYGRGIWETPIPAKATPDFVVSVDPQSVTVYPGRSASISGTLTYFKGYNSPITIACSGTSSPATCTGASLAAGATLFSVTVANPTAADFQFDIQASGSDGTVHAVPVVVHVVDFSIGALSPSSLTVANGTQANFSFTVTPTGTLPSPIHYGCTSSNPTLAPVTCTFTSVESNGAFAVNAAITAGPFATAGTYSLTMTGTTADGLLTHGAPAPLGVTITTNKTFEFVRPLPTVPVVMTGQKAAPVALTIGSQDGFAGDVSLTCSSNRSAPACALSTSPGGAPASPLVVTLVAGGQVTVYVTLDATNGGGGSGSLQVVGTTSAPADQTTNSVLLPYNVSDFNITIYPGPSSITVFPGGGGVLPLLVQSLGQYTGTVNVTCAGDAGVSCTPAAATISISAGIDFPFSENLSVAPGASLADKNVTVSVSDGNLVRSVSGVVHMQDFQMQANPTSATIKAGSSSTHTISLAGLNGFSQAVALSVSGCPSTALMNCSLSNATPTVDSAGSTVTLTITTTAASAALGAPPLPRRRAPLFALWLGLPAIALGIAGGAPSADGGSISHARSRRRCAVLTICAFALLLILTACGGGSGSSTLPPAPKPGTPAGSYSIVVTATAGGGQNVRTQITTVNLTVQ